MGEEKKQSYFLFTFRTKAGTFGGNADVSAFAASQTGEVGSVTAGIGAWWKTITTEVERSSWAVLDLHNYIAWNPDVKGFDTRATSSWVVLQHEMVH